MTIKQCAPAVGRLCTPVARTQLIRPTQKGAIYQIKEACEKYNNDDYGKCVPYDFPKLKGFKPPKNNNESKGYPDGTLEEFSVRVKVCADDKLRLQDKHNTESCVPYRVESKGNTTITYKPGFCKPSAGTSQVEFGLITGSNSNNLQGGAAAQRC